jgi:hypothetical protein
MGQARKDVPRWKRKSLKPGPSANDVRKLTREVEQLRKAAPAQNGHDPRKRPEHQDALGRTGTWRFRRHILCFWWAAWPVTGLWAHTRLQGPVSAAVAAVAITGLTIAFTRHLDDFPRSHQQLSAAVAGASCALVAFTGSKPVLYFCLLAWGGMSALWVTHYRWRPVRPEAPADTSVQDAFGALAVKRRWNAWLGEGKAIPGGMVFPIQCRGSDTHIGEVVAQPKAIAATFSSTVAQVYAEESPFGLQDKGDLFMLRKATLEDIRAWDGLGVNRTTGLARLGRWPDEKVVYEQVISLPMDGTKHCMVAGADGSGKSALLDQGIANSAITGWIAPIILDPQQGQALPAWLHAVPYARGTTQCLIWLKALQEAMLARSAYLAGVTWISPKDGKRRRGMGFFNPFIMIVDPVTGQPRPLGLPVIEITIDEAPLLLAVPGAKELLLNLIKLGRKAGVRIRLAAQVPSLNELKLQEIRSLLIGGGAFCLRTGDKVSANMMNITAAPWELPKLFPNGQKTHGLGYASTLENRPNTPFRADWLEDPWEVAETTKIAKPDDRFAARMAEIIAEEDATTEQLGAAADAAARLQLLIISMLPKHQGELIQQLQGDYRLTEVSSAITGLLAAGKAVRQKDIIKAA